MQIIGHEKILNFLDLSIKNNALNHAYLFTGPEHLGKFTVALEFAKKIVNREEKKEEINPDIIIVVPEIEEKNGIIKKKDIKIEKIREVEHAFSLSSYFGGFKVTIVDEAERMTIAAQNALLKTLEEPAKKCIVILVSHDAEKILPTVKSRCVHKKFNLVGEELISKKLGGDISDEIKTWSLGRPGLALEIERNKKRLAQFRVIEKSLRVAIEGNVAEKLEMAQELSKDMNSLVVNLEYWIVFLRKNLMSGLFLSFSRERSLEMIDEIAKSMVILRETNSNSKVILENLLLKF